MAEKKGLIIRMADKFSLEPAKFMETLKGTIMKPGKDGKPVSDAEIAAFLVVADQYGLNPFTKEIYAFPDKRGGIIPVVGVDGWMRKISEHEQFNGMEIRWAETATEMPGGKPCPDWCEVVIYRKDREHPMVIREYLDEVYKTKEQNGGFAGPWQSHTKRFLRHKTIIQGGRAAFGLSGIYDEDEASRIVEQQERDMGDVHEVKKSSTVKAKVHEPEIVTGEGGEILESVDRTPVEAEIAHMQTIDNFAHFKNYWEKLKKSDTWQTFTNDERKMLEAAKDDHKEMLDKKKGAE